MDRVEKALDYHDRGYNCAQCVLMAYSDYLGVDERIAFRAAEGFGAGMGDFSGACGSLTGAVIAAGLTTDGGGIEGELTKQDTYQTVADIRKEFKSLVGSEICCEIRETEDRPALMNCEDCIITGVELVGKMLKEKGRL